MAIKVTSQAAPSCLTCYSWNHKVRGRNCRINKRVKINGRKRTGTPPDYHCKEYIPLTHATCSDCIHWEDKRIPRRKDTCSNMDLQDDTGRDRTSRSTLCKLFNQKSSLAQYNNKGLRIDGTLATVMDISQHSTQLPIVVRTSDNSGILARWNPNGPGSGEWTILPVELDEVDGILSTSQHNTGDVLAETDVLFSGSAIINSIDRTLEVFGQASTKMIGDKLRHGVSSILLRVKARRKRRGSNSDSKERSILDTPPVARVQDEPWGADWEDLKEQMANMLDAGESPSKSSKRIRRTWEKDIKRRLGKDTAARLEAQLKVAHRG